MNTHQLMCLATSCPDIGSNFLGVFASDKLPKTIRTPSSLIANLDRSEDTGSHWVALFFPNDGLAEYMDSYGFAPSTPFREILGSTFRCNKTFLQSPFSAVCGQYCLYFLMQRNRLSSMNSVLSVFKDDDQFYNDVLVNRYIERHFSVDLNLFDHKWQAQQICDAFAL